MARSIQKSRMRQHRSIRSAKNSVFRRQRKQDRSKRKKIRCSRKMSISKQSRMQKRIGGISTLTSRPESTVLTSRPKSTFVDFGKDTPVVMIPATTFRTCSSL